MKQLKIQTSLLLIALMLFCWLRTNAQPHTAPAKLSTASAKNMPWGPNAKTYGADLPIHVADAHIYMEIPANCIGRQLFISAQVDRGFDLIAHPVTSVGVVRITAPDAKTIRLVPLQCQDENGAERDTTASDSADDYAILARTQTGAAIIDITNQLLTGNQWFSYQELIDIRDMEPELSSLLKVEAAGDVTQFRIRRYHGMQAEDKVYSSSLILLPEGSAPLDLSCRVQLLPQAQAPVRLAAQGMPNLTVPAECSSLASHDSQFVQRWALNGPLMFYVDSLFPPQYVNAVKAGVQVWNGVLARAGIPRALQVERVTPQTAVQGQGVYVSFELSSHGAKSQTLCHPLSGQLLRGWINIDCGALEGKTPEYFLNQPQLDTRFWDEAYTDTLVQEAVQGDVMAKVAQVLGIKSEADYGPGALQVTNADARAAWYAYAPAEGRTPAEQRAHLLKRLSAMPQTASAPASPFAKQVRKMDNALLLIPHIDQKTNRQAMKKERGYPLMSAYRHVVNAYSAQLEALADSFGEEKSQRLQRQGAQLLVKYVVLADSGLNSKLITQNQLMSKMQLMGSSLDQVFDQLLGLPSLERLLKQGKRKGGYGANEHVNLFIDALFNRFDATKMPSTHLANLQLRCIEALNTAANKAKRGSEVQLWLQRKVVAVRGKLGAMAQKCTNEAAAQWFRLLQNRR